MTPARPVTRVGPIRQRTAVVVFLLIGATALAGTLGMAVSMLQQSRELGTKVELTQSIVNANVRTLTQTQRELLRLQLLYAGDGAVSAEEADLQAAFVAQRAREGALQYQVQTLRSGSLLQRAKTLEARVNRDLLPLVEPARGTGPAARVARARLLREIAALELEYNTLVSEGEINRKRQAGEANADSRELFIRAQNMVLGMLVTFGIVVLFLAVGSLAYLVFHRQRERANRALIEANFELERYAHVVEATDNMVIITDPDGTIAWVNPAFVEGTGYARGEVVGRNPGHVLQGPDTDADVVMRMRNAQRQGLPFNEEVLNYSKAGHTYWVSLEASPLRDEGGHFTGYVAVQRDITERREAERLLREAKESAEQTARVKSEFLATMSHEIRTPLNSVLGLTDLLLLTDLDESQREYVQTAHTSGRMLLGLVNDILDLSALEAGRIEGDLRPFPLRTTIGDTTAMFRRSAEKRGITVESHIDDRVPAWVIGDEIRFRQILVNLVDNAVRFTRDGGVRIMVTPSPVSSAAAAEESGEATMLRITIQDTGIGIAPDQQARIFEPFTQADASTTRRFGGSGLGLSICRLLAERLGGRLMVCSELGQGSLFVIDLPMPGSALAPEAFTPRPRTVTAPGLRVLLAEDDLVNQTVARHMLARLAVDVTVVGDGECAVDAVRNGEFDVVLMDVHMPGMDGIQATAAIRSALPPDRQPWIVAVTANAMEGDREQLLNAGMNDYVSKPILLSDLAAVLERAAGARRQTRPVEPAMPGAHHGVVDVQDFLDRTGTDVAFLHALAGLVVDQGEAACAAVGRAVTGNGGLSSLAPDLEDLATSAESCSAGPVAAVARVLAAACAATSDDRVNGLLPILVEELTAVRAWLEEERLSQPATRDAP